MPLIKTVAVVGSAYEAGDKDLIVHLLARECGRLSVAIRGGKSSKGGRAAALQPLAEVEVTAYLREGKDLGTLRESAVVNPHTGLRGDLNRLALASFLLDVALETSLPGHPTPDAYDGMCRALEGLEGAVESPPLTEACHWLLRLLSIVGVEPTIDETLLTGAWGRRKPRKFLLYIAEGVIAAAPGEPGAHALPGSGDDGAGKVATGGPRGWTLRPAAVRAVYENQRTETDRLAALPALAPGEAMGLLRALTALAIHHLDIRPRSLRFLEQTVFKGLG